MVFVGEDSHSSHSPVSYITLVSTQTTCVISSYVQKMFSSLHHLYALCFLMKFTALYLCTDYIFCRILTDAEAYKKFNSGWNSKFRPQVKSNSLSAFESSKFRIYGFGQSRWSQAESVHVEEGNTLVLPDEYGRFEIWTCTRKCIPPLVSYGTTVMNIYNYTVYCPWMAREYVFRPLLSLPTISAGYLNVTL